ncbi:MAG TPA: M23 family metallopeptidase [Thermoanaerobaculia bacterium]
MIRRGLSLLLIASISTVSAAALEVRVRQFHSTPLSSPDQEAASTTRPPLVKSDAGTLTAEPPSFLVYPVAGTVGRDVAIPYYVDLDDSSAKVDFNCTDLTFNGHSGHDPYIRSFAEQEIGVPVFAVRDGLVIDVRDGQPDQNTVADPAFKTNYIVLRHNDDQVTQYAHLRRNSITAQVGDTVTAGTQIGLVGSSGASTAPHIHFEARVGDVSYEPLAGPCRAGRNYFDENPGVADDPMILGAMFSASTFENLRPAPYADATPTGTFAMGPRTIYFRTELANVGASTTYSLSLAQPSGVSATVSNGVLTKYDASLSSAWWGIDVNLDRTGTWLLRLDVNNGRQIFTMPFTVVANSSEIVNRPPNPVTAAIEPLGLRGGDVPVCRVSNSGLADPDYDVVRYRYEWRADGTVVRDVTTAAQSDALGRQYATAGSTLTCTVTASDAASAATQPVMATAVVNGGRRRAVAK